MEQNKKWLQWAVELQSPAQAGPAYGVYRVFVQCAAAGGRFEKTIETTERRCFSPDELPELKVAQPLF